MALSFSLEQAGHTAESLNVDATVTLSKVERGFDITKIHLDLKPELCNRNRDEGIKRKERGTYVDEA